MENTISISRALKKLPILEKRIRCAISNTQFVFLTKADPNALIEGVPHQNIREETKAAWQSLNDMIAEYAYIKSQITKSNAETHVRICDCDYTVAELLEMKKNSIAFRESLCNNLQNQLNTIRIKAETGNERLTEKAADMVQRLMGDKESKSEKYMETLNSIIEKERLVVYDPIDASQEIKKLLNFLDRFREDVDSVLDESNATTMIKAF